LNGVNAQQLLSLLALLGGVAGKVIGGKAGQVVTVGDDLLLVAQQALALHAQAVGKPMDEVLGQLHDLPPLPEPS
jgi:hypothetical protein